jgi:hypothetical protein
MSLFEFIVGMVSIILALAVAQLFIGVADLIQRRDHVRFFLPHSIWIVNLFFLIFLHWWSLWAFRDLPWNFAMFFYSLIGPSLMFFDAAMLGPRDLSVERIDVPAHFLGIRQVFLSVFMITILLVTLDGPLFGTEDLLNGIRAGQTLVLAMAAWGVISKNPRVQLVVSLTVLAGLSAVAVFRFFPGQ